MYRIFYVIGDYSKGMAGNKIVPTFHQVIDFILSLERGYEEYQVMVHKNGEQIYHGIKRLTEE